ncbi:MAG: hypothetical protein JO206_03840 [Solirubrobacterales bacterium]|nr:hypothetical protein [Solirubrobacterales bacterium]
MDAAARSLGVVGREFQRALLIQLGWALETRDEIVETARKYTDAGKLNRELARFERRGERFIRGRQRGLSRRRRDLEHSAGQAREQAASVVGGARDLV